MHRCLCIGIPALILQYFAAEKGEQICKADRHRRNCGVKMNGFELLQRRGKEEKDGITERSLCYTVLKD